MAKKSSEKSTGADVDVNTTRDIVHKSDPKIPIGKYLQLYGEAIHPYTRAYVGAEFRGIMKTREEWSRELKTYMEGNK